MYLAYKVTNEGLKNPPWLWSIRYNKSVMHSNPCERDGKNTVLSFLEAGNSGFLRKDHNVFFVTLYFCWKDTELSFRVSSSGYAID